MVYISWTTQNETNQTEKQNKINVQPEYQTSERDKRTTNIGLYYVDALAALFVCMFVWQCVCMAMEIWTEMREETQSKRPLMARTD